jgi:hypothetical protein
MPGTTPRNYISALYAATFNRAPDKAGLTFWETSYAADPAVAIRNIALGFTNHPAFTTLYGGLNNPDFVSAIYVNVLGGPGENEGITFWTNLLDAGLSRSDFLADFVYDALTVDINSTNFPSLSQAELDAAIIRQDYLTNKAEVGLFFADTLGADSNLSPTTDSNTLDGPNGLNSDPAYQASQAILAGVTNDDNSVSAAETLINTAATQSDPAAYILGHPPGETFTLTPNTDTVSASSPNAPDHVSGVIDGTDTSGSTGGSTYTVGDTVNGNGHTIVELVVAVTGTAAIANLNNVADVNIIADVSGTIKLSGVKWSDVGAVNLTDGANGLDVILTNLEDDTDLSITSGAAGTISADYQSHLFVRLEADEVSALSWIDGDVDATVAANEAATFTAFMQTGDLTVGDINATVGTSGTFDVIVSSTGSDDISVGDITITAETNASVFVSVSNDDGGSVTVGDVSLFGGASEFLGVFNQDAIGDVSIGDVEMSVSASGSLVLNVSNTGTTGESLGSLTVGNIDLALDHDATGSVDIRNSNSYTTDGLSLGALTVGDMVIDLGADATFEVSITQSASGSTANVLASFGDVAVGNLTANLGIGATMNYDVQVENSLAGDIALVTIGDVTLALDDGATMSYRVSVTAEKGDITSFAMGNLDITLGVDASIDSFVIDLDALKGGNIGTVAVGDVSIIGATGTATGVDDFSAYTLGVYATSGTIGNATAGDVTVFMGPNAGFQYFATISGDQGVADVTLGDFDLTSHNAKTFTAGVSVTAANGDIGSVTIGDVSIAATGTLTTAFFTVDVNASGIIGELNVGVISIDTTDDAAVSVDINASGGLVDGTINIGGLSLDGTASASYTQSTFNAGNGAFSGDINFGDISVGVSLTGITGVAQSLDLTSLLGGVTTTVGNDNITLGSVDYSGLVLDWAAGNPDAGNGVAIELSSYQGNTSVIGSDYNDTIFDNTGINLLTGGDGADTFIFDTANTGKTLATMDQVLDFKNADKDKLDVGVTPHGSYAEQSFTDFGAFNTGANTADKDVYVGLVGGDGGDNLIVAVDFDGNNAVDFMIQLVGVNSLNDINLASFV